MRAIRLESGSQYKSWESKGFRVVKECIQKLAESLAYEVVQQGTQKVTRVDAERWLQQTPTFVKMLEYVFLHLYHYRASTKNPQDEAIAIRRKSVVAESNKLLPFCEGIFFLLKRKRNQTLTHCISFQVFNTCQIIQHSRIFHRCYS